MAAATCAVKQNIKKKKITEIEQSFLAFFRRASDIYLSFLIFSYNYFLNVLSNQKWRSPNSCTPLIPINSLASDSSNQTKHIYKKLKSKNLNPRQWDQELMDKVMRMSSEKGVVIFTKSSCCLCYAVQILFRDLRVQPTIHEIENDPDCREIEKALLRLGCSTAVPAVFVGGKLVGSTNEVMSLHLSGSLVPLIKPYQSLLY